MPGFRWDSGVLWDSGYRWDGVLADEHPPPSSSTVRTRLLVLASIAGAVRAVFEGETGVLTGGSVTADRSRTVRRSGELQLADPRGVLVPRGTGDLLSVGSVLRLERGTASADDTEWLPLATLVVSRWRSSMEGVVDVSGEDPTALLARPFGETVVVTAGTPAEDALRALWSPVLGDGSEWPLDAGGRLMPLRVFLPDEDRLDAVARAMMDCGLEVFADRLGQPLMRPWTDPADAPDDAVVQSFTPGPESTLLDLSRSSEGSVYNQVTVESTSPAGPDVSVTLTVSDPASPIHPDAVGLRPAPPHRTAGIPDLAAAGAVALRILRDHASAVDSVLGSAVPDPTVDAGDTVVIEEPLSGASGRWLVDRITLPAVSGPMSIEAGRVLRITAPPVQDAGDPPPPLPETGEASTDSGTYDFGEVEV